MAPPTSTDVEKARLNLEETYDPDIGRFSYLTGATSKQAKSYLHRSHATGSGRPHFNDALKEYFKKHDHEDHMRYVPGSDECRCLETASQRILNEIIKDAWRGSGQRPS